MILRNIDFGIVSGASGVQGFFGHGYWFHQVGYPFGLDFKGVTFCAKTTTLKPRQGNMKLLDYEFDFAPARYFPNCVAVNLRTGVAVNSVGLSGPGAEALLLEGQWQKWPHPFMLSFMSVAGSPEERLAELREFVDLLGYHLPNFFSSVALQMNFSCPNAGLEPMKLISEIESSLEVASTLNIPLIPKVTVMLSPRVAARIAKHKNCDAICVTNTIPWDQVDPRERLKHFGSLESPLALRKNPWGEPMGKGGVSGRPLLPLLTAWIENARQAGLKKPIIGGGGILSVKDARAVIYAGAEQISLGSVAFLRPWRVRGIVKKLQEPLWEDGREN